GCARSHAIRSKQTFAKKRVPIPMKLGRPVRFDYEYQRNGTPVSRFSASAARMLESTSKRRSHLERLYQRVVDDLDALVGAWAPKRRDTTPNENKISITAAITVQITVRYSPRRSLAAILHPFQQHA